MTGVLDLWQIAVTSQKAKESQPKSPDNIWKTSWKKSFEFFSFNVFFSFFFFMFCFFLTVKGHKYLRTKHFDIITRSTKLKWTCISLYCWTRGNLSFRLSPTWEQRLWTEIYSSPCVVSFDVVAVQFLFYFYMVLNGLNYNLKKDMSI